MIGGVLGSGSNAFGQDRQTHMLGRPLTLADLQ